MTEIDLTEFESEIKLRPLAIEDFDALVAMQSKCFPSMQTWTREQIASQIAHFPEGQLVIEYDGRLVEVTENPGVIDNGDDQGNETYSETGSGWTLTSDPAVYGGNYRQHAAGTGENTARWTYTGMAPTQLYEVLVTWKEDADRATDATFTVRDGETVKAVRAIDQQAAPGGVTLHGVTWKSLGYFTATEGELSVELTDDADGLVIADAVKIIEKARAPEVIDNSTGGFTTIGAWTTSVAGATYRNTFQYSAAGMGADQAFWVFDGLESGQEYEIQVSYKAQFNHASNAPFTILDGNIELTTELVNQQVAASQIAFENVLFNRLAIVTSETGQLTVKLTDDANGIVVADAIRILPVAAAATVSAPTAIIAGMTATIAGTSGGDFGTHYTGFDLYLDTGVIGVWEETDVWLDSYSDAGFFFEVDTTNEEIAESIAQAGGTLNLLIRTNSPVEEVVSVQAVSVQITDNRVILDNDQQGYFRRFSNEQEETGPETADHAWRRTTGNGYQGDYRETFKTAGTYSAVWTADTLPDGTYDVYATYTKAPTNTQNASFSVYDQAPQYNGNFYEIDGNGFPDFNEMLDPLVTRNLNQRALPDDLAPLNPPNDKIWWEKIGTVTSRTGTLSVEVKYTAPGDCWVVADAVMFVQVPTVYVTDAYISEGSGSVSVEVTLSHAGLVPVTVQYASSDENAADGYDYLATQGTLTFQPGETSKSIQITILDDSVAEYGEDFTVTFSSVAGATLDGDESTLDASVWIHDDDSVAHIDLDIDSDNTNGADRPDRSEAEENLEEDSEAYGKVIPVNNGDADEDGIPDFADGFDLPQSVLDDLAADGISPANAIANPFPMEFTPLVVELPASYDLSTTRLKFVYNGSDPGQVTYAEGQLIPAEGVLRLWIKNGSEQRNPNSISASQPGDYVAPTTADSDGDVYTPQQLGFSESARTVTLYVEGVAASEGAEYIEVIAAPEGSFVQEGAPKESDKNKVQLPNIDLDARMVGDNAGNEAFNETGDWLAEGLERTKGAYVPANNDDDDYNQRVDRTDASLGVNENDLLPVAIKVPAGTPGIFRIAGLVTSGDRLVTTEGLRIWRQGGEGEPAFVNIYRKSGNTVHAQDLTLAPGASEILLFVEGKGNAGVDYYLQVVWKPDAGAEFTKFPHLIKIRQFDVKGPRNVPGFSSYAYGAVGGRAGEATFVAARHGNITGAGPAAVTLTWNVNDPVFGKVRYTASAEYVWAFDVNIVKIELDLAMPLLIPATSVVKQSVAGDKNYLDSVSFYSTPPTNADLVTIPGFRPAMEAHVTITEMTGPRRDGDAEGVERGVRFMDVGFIQKLKFTKYEAVYEGGAVLKARSPGVDSLEGNTLLDQITVTRKAGRTYRDAMTDPNASESTKRSDKPWYDSNRVTGNALFTSTADAVADPVELVVSDTPIPQFAAQPMHNGRPLDTVNIIWDFELIVSARTRDGGRVEADSRFIERAIAKWKLDASGDIANASPTSFGTWSATGTGVTQVEAFAEQTGGVARVLDSGSFGSTTNRKVVNDALRTGFGFAQE